tara:strand:+ start:87 stop:344 length:258 start_codon:yes stop_codon:yes gene_type:complete
MTDKKDWAPIDRILSKWGKLQAYISLFVLVIIYRLVDYNTLDWFGKSNDMGVIEYYGGLLICAALFWSVIFLILIPILQFFKLMD